MYLTTQFTSFCMFEIFPGREDIVKVLIEQGADFNAKNSFGMTPLDYASIWGKIKWVA